MRPSAKHGFIALIIVLSITGLLFALVSASSIEAVIFYDEVLKKEYRSMNYYNANNCIDQAILAIAHDYFIEFTNSREIPELDCTIISIVREGNLRHITTRGNFQKAIVYRYATVRVSDTAIEIISL